MRFPNRLTQRRLPAVLCSLVLHGAVFALILWSPRTPKVAEPVFSLNAVRIQTAGGSHAIRLVLPLARDAAHTRNPDHYAEATRKTLLPVPPTHHKAGGGSPKMPHAGDGSGLAKNGLGSADEDRDPAFPIFSPRPPVTDRSLLPHSEQKVVVEVTVDSLGAVVSETLAKGVGNKLDQMVLDIVKTWKFQPAMINGKPVASQAEIIFPFNQNYPIAPS
ncbi:MAG TPA: TonB family protein [Terracidiphilus sp.]|nr:TonB family protein [Terracidiphilus sp.]